jgi:Rtf2 RING-finger
LPRRAPAAVRDCYERFSPFVPSFELRRLEVPWTWIKNFLVEAEASSLSHGPCDRTLSRHQLRYPMGKAGVGEGGAGFGAGNDGGSIAAIRSILVKEKKEDRGTVQRAKESAVEKWRTCALSGNPLQVPIVADDLGSLFNKDSVLEFLLERRDVAALSHIKSLKKDVLELKVTTASASGSSSSSSGAAGSSLTAVKIMCPVTMLEANGSHPFCAMRNCGCVVSERAVRELASTVLKCPNCETAFASNADVLKLVPNEEELAIMRERLAQKKKEQKKPKKEGGGDSAAAANTKTGEAEANKSDGEKLKRARPMEPGDEGAEGGDNKRRRLTEEASNHDHKHHNIPERIGSDLAALAAVEAARAIEENKKRSAVYASLFSSSSSSSSAAASGAGGALAAGKGGQRP